MKNSYTEDRMWLPSTSRLMTLFSSDEGGDKSINLLEVRGQCRADFWKVVKDGRMIDRWHQGPVMGVDHEFATALALTVLWFLRRGSAIQHGKGGWRPIELLEDPSGVVCGNAQGIQGTGWMIRPQPGSERGRAFILTLKKKMTTFPNAFHLV